MNRVYVTIAITYIGALLVAWVHYFVTGKRWSVLGLLALFVLAAMLLEPPDPWERPWYRSVGAKPPPPISQPPRPKR